MSPGDVALILFSTFGASNGCTAFAANKSLVSLASGMLTILDNAVSRLRSQAAKLGTNVAILETRLDFTETYVNTLEGGSDKLTLADLNEEGANLIALQTRQQLGIQSLSIAGQQQQAILARIQSPVGAIAPQTWAPVPRGPVLFTPS